MNKKEKYYDKYLKSLLKGENVLEADQARLELLKQDSPKKKLYKYCIFNEYAIQAIENNTIHFSSPSNFNDPFDCKIGLSIGCLSDSVFSKEMHLIKSCTSEVFDRLLDCQTDSSVSEEETRIVDKILTKKEIVNSVNSAKEMLLNNQKDEAATILFQTFLDLIIIILSLTAQNEIEMEFFKLMNSIVAYVKKRLDKIEFGQNLSIEQLFEVTSISKDKYGVGLSMSISEKLQLAKPQLINNAITLLSSSFKSCSEAITDAYTVACLTTRKDNRLMWSHYANCHRGICIEYDFSHCELSRIPFPVMYSEKRIQMPWNEIMNPTTENQERAKEIIVRSILTKDKVWKYENEWRILNTSSQDSNQEMPQISCIYVGEYCPENDTNILIKLGNERGIPVKRMVTDGTGYSLFEKDISN